MSEAKSTGKVRAEVNILIGARAALRLTQAELAAAAGVDLGTLNALENGRKKTREDVRAKVQAALERRGVVFTNGEKPGFHLATDGKILPVV